MRFSFFLKTLLVGTAALLVARFCERQTEGFSLLAISSCRLSEKRWETPPLSHDEEITLKTALSQKYRYVGAGGQSYIFFSEDNRFAMKFLKQRKYRLPFWLHACPMIPYKVKKLAVREDKLNRDFTSYQLAMSARKEETGLIAVHLTKTEHLNTMLTIVDKLGIQHQIDLDQMDFILQKRADLFYDRIAAEMRANHPENAKRCITATLEFLVAESQKGYYDRDQNLRTNCGFIGDTAIKIDIGRLSKQDSLKDPHQFHTLLKPFKAWLQDNYPTLISHLNQEVLRLALDD